MPIIDTMTAYGSSSRFPLSLSSSQPRTHHPVPEPTSEDQEMVEVDLGDNGDEAEYNVDRILDVETRVVKGESVRYYLIQWEGDWDNTWEPQQNVGYVDTNLLFRSVLTPFFVAQGRSYQRIQGYEANTC